MDAILYFQSSAKWSAGGKLAGVREIAAPSAIHVQVVDNVAPDAGSVAELAAFWKPLGAIVDAGSFEWLDATAFSALPTVFISGDASALPRNAPLVRHDSAATARLAARELLETGSAELAFVPSRERRHWSEERGHAFEQAARLNGRKCHTMRCPENVGADGDPTVWQRSLRDFLRALPRPCGVFAANDATAAEVLAAARFEGLEVPGDLAVIGVDNFVETCENTVPTLSSVEPDFRAAGRMAAARLLDMTRTGARHPAARSLSFGPLGVVRRASTRRVAASDRHAALALEKIRREACSGLRARDVASLFPCSRRMADARFRKAAGRSILEEIHAVRLEAAKRLLVQSDMPLKAISDFCGFENPNSMRKFFRRETGAAMRIWRAKARKSP